MNITSSNQNQFYPQFQARFSKEYLQRLIKEASDSTRVSDPREAIPQLYTCVKYIDSILPDTKLKPLSRFNYDCKSQGYGRTIYYIKDEGNSVLGQGRNSYLNALINMCVKDGEKDPSSHLRMPQCVFENQWWTNRNVKPEEIEKFALDINA